MIVAKRAFDTAIMQNFKQQAADTFPIKMIEIEKIKPNEKNFYAVEEIELLAEDIDRQGLRHNLVVLEDDDEYKIISGHRRFAAVSFLISAGKWNSRFLPCSVSAARSDPEEMLDLVMLNATARVISDRDVMLQFEKIDEIFRENKDLAGTGGRVRDKIAGALGVSPAQVGKLENIKRNASEEIKAAVMDGSMSISTANEAARLDEEAQRELVREVGASGVTNRLAKAKREEKSAPVRDERTDFYADIDDEKVDTSIHFPRDCEDAEVDISIRMEDKTAAEIDEMCDSGMLNSIIEGYVLLALEELGLADEAGNLRFSRFFDEHSAAEARARVGEL